jgi:hypothetical protein
MVTVLRGDRSKRELRVFREPSGSLDRRPRSRADDDHV